MRVKESKEEEMYSILNELDIEKTVLENTLSQPQEELDKYPEYLLEQYEEELEMFKRTINYIEKLYEENKELREITNGYNSLKKDSEAFGGIPLIIADEKYFNDGIFKESYINKDKIRKIINEELPDDEICEVCGNYDVNGVVIKQKLIKVLEEE